MDYANLESHPEADDEIEAAFDWYAARSVDAAESFLDELAHAISQIMESPNRWAKYMYGTRRFIMKRYPYLVVYREIDSRIVQIVAVAHGHRSPGYWRSRVEE